LYQNGAPSALLSIGEAEKSRMCGGPQSWCFRWKRKCDTVCCDATSSSFGAKVQGEVFAHFHVVAAERYSSMRNRLFGLPGRILCDQSP
jgi:hypothetical protein